MLALCHWTYKHYIQYWGKLRVECTSFYIQIVYAIGNLKTKCTESFSKPWLFIARPTAFSSHLIVHSFSQSLSKFVEYSTIPLRCNYPPWRNVYLSMWDSTLHRTKAESVSISDHSIGSVPSFIGSPIVENVVLLTVQLWFWHHQTRVVLCAPVFNI